MPNLRTVKCCCNCKHWHEYMSYEYDKFGDHIQYCDLKIKGASPEKICDNHDDGS